MLLFEEVKQKERRKRAKEKENDHTDRYTEA